MERYFYTTSTFKLGDKIYKPCVSYETASLKEEQIKHLLSEKRIVLSTDYVFFINGKPVSKKQVEERDEQNAIAKRNKQKHKKEEKQTETATEPFSTHLTETVDSAPIV